MFFTIGKDATQNTIRKNNLLGSVSVVRFSLAIREIEHLQKDLCIRMGEGAELTKLWRSVFKDMTEIEVSTKL